MRVMRMGKFVILTAVDVLGRRKDGGQGLEALCHGRQDLSYFETSQDLPGLERYR